VDLRELAEKDPKQFQALARSLNNKLVIPHGGGQQAIMEDQHRFQIVCCGRRFGKTVVAAKKALRRTRDKSAMVWWVAPTYASWRFPTSANPHLPPEEIEEMRHQMPLLVFQQEVLAEFVASAGQVFRWSPEAITSALAKPKGHVFVGVDLAKKVDFTVFYATNEDGMPCGFDRMNEVAWKMQRNRLHGFVKKLKDQGARHVTLVMDSTGVGDPIVEEVEAAGYDVIPVNFRSLKQNMVTQLSKDLEDGYARLLDKHIEEFENYTYEITASGNFKYSAPEGQHDDVVSAKMLQHWGLTQEGAPNITAVSAADDPDPQDTEAPEGYDVGDDDWSDLIDSDEATDTGRPEVTVIRPDSAASIMARRDAWA
jgi:hypothetical protein